MTEVYRIPRVEIAAQIALGENQVRVVRLFLGTAAEAHPGPERPSDLLNRPNPFMPALERGQVVFFNLEAVHVITVAADLEFATSDTTWLDVALQQQTHRRVQVGLRGGTVVRGDLTYHLPEGNRRVQDFLNGTERFFALQDGDMARFVNRQQVVWLTTD
jgi:hypothetical protein